MSASVDVRVATAAWRAELRPDPRSFCRRAVRAALAAGAAPAPECDVSLLLTDDAEMAKLNATWRGIDQPTNVLAFVADDVAAPAAGDIAVSYATVAREARAQGVSVGEHAAHMIVHGVLHLLGYRHAEDAEAREMAAAEVRALAQLGIADPYRETAMQEGETS